MDQQDQGVKKDDQVFQVHPVLKAIEALTDFQAGTVNQVLKETEDFRVAMVIKD